VITAFFAPHRSGCLKLLLGNPGGSVTYAEPDEYLLRVNNGELTERQTGRLRCYIRRAHGSGPCVEIVIGTH
jgi:hypothetical protein